MLVNGYPLPDGELSSETFEDAVLSKIMNLTPDIQIYLHGNYLNLYKFKFF